MKKVAIIDDDTDFLTLVQYLLKMNGFDVHIISGVDVVAQILEIYPDLILLDKNLADRQSHMIYDQLKAVANIPVVLWSAHRGKAVFVLNARDEYVEKPMTMEGLLKLVNEHITARP